MEPISNSRPQLISITDEVFLKEKMVEKETSLTQQSTNRQRTNTALHVVTISTIALAIIFGAPWITVISAVSFTLSLHNKLKNSKTAQLIELIKQDRLDLNCYKELFNSCSKSLQILNLEKVENTINSEHYHILNSQLVKIGKKFDLQFVRPTTLHINKIIVDKEDSKFKANLDKIANIKNRLSLSYNHLSLAMEAISLPADKVKQDVIEIKEVLKRELQHLQIALDSGKAKIENLTKDLYKKYVTLARA